MSILVDTGAKPRNSTSFICRRALSGSSTSSNRTTFNVPAGAGRWCVSAKTAANGWFDCFDRTPHYHCGFSYVDQPLVPIDVAAVGNPLEWVCSRIETRLPALFEKARAGHLAATCGAGELRAVASELLSRCRALSP